jgi:hypothetical protein
MEFISALNIAGRLPPAHIDEVVSGLSMISITSNIRVFHRYDLAFNPEFLDVATRLPAAGSF